MTGAAFLSLLQVLLLVGSLLTTIKLYVTGLYKQYPIFFCYFITRTVNSVLPLLLDNRSPTYFWVYICMFPIVLAFYFLLVMELYRLVLRDYRGLQTVGRWAMYASAIGSAVISILSLIPTIKPSMPYRSQVVRYILAGERGINLALLVFIVLLLAILSRYPIRLRRNVRIHAIVYSIFFFSNSMEALARTLLGLKLGDTLNTVNLVVSLGSMLAWLILLSPAGEKVADRKPAADPEHERRLMTQLEGLNVALLRVSRQKVG